MHHSNIVPVFEVGREGDTFFYTMQLIEGQSLDVVIQDLSRLRDQSRRGAQAHQGAAENPAGSFATQEFAAADSRSDAIESGIAVSLWGGRLNSRRSCTRLGRRTVAWASTGKRSSFSGARGN